MFHRPLLRFILVLVAIAPLLRATNAAVPTGGHYDAVFNTAPIPRQTDGGTSRAATGPLMGNGDMGVTITGGPEEQTFWITKNDFWLLRNGSATPLNFGTLCIKTPAMAGATYAARTSPGDAMTRATFTSKDSTLTQTGFVAATANVLVVRLACTGKPMEVEASFAPNPFDARIESADAGEADGVRFSTRTLEKTVTVPTAGTTAWKLMDAKAPKFTLEPGKPVTLLLSMASNFDATDTKAKALELLKNADPAALENAHRAWWRGFWNKSFVEIPDADIMRRYWLSRYILASASRNPKFPPAIIGPWATNKVGWCGYWMNYNHAAPYYGLYASNNLDQADPQDAPILDFLPTGEKYAKDIFDGKVRGALYSVGIGPFGLDAAGLGPATRTDRQFEMGITTWGQRSNTAYNLVNFAQRWYTTYDPDYGKKIYSYAKAVADFWEDFLVKEDDGKGGYRYGVVGDSVHEGSGKNRNPNMTLGMVKNAFRIMLDLSKELDRDADRRAKWEDIVTHLAPFTAVQWGREKKNIFVLGEDPARLWGDNTLHIQHIYPAGAIGLDSDPALLDTGRNTIAMTARWHDGNGSNSFFPAAARVGYDPMIILRELRAYSSGGMGPNGFSKGNPHGIENCSTVPNTLQEMLMQSHEGVIRLFPVWPRDLDARFGTLRAYGAFLVSAGLKSGVVSGVSLHSEKGRDLVVQNPWPGKAVAVTRDGKSAGIVSGERITLKSSPGETLALAPR